jgi:YHS domain-containing protein
MSPKFLGLFGKNETAKDPVCGMDVDVKKAPGGTHMFDDVIYYFCGPGCRVAFSKEPMAYISGEKKMEM